MGGREAPGWPGPGDPRCPSQSQMCGEGGAPPANSIPFQGSAIVPGMTRNVLTPALASSQQLPTDAHHAYFSNEDPRLLVNVSPRVTRLVTEWISELGGSRAHPLLGKK